MKKLKTSNTDVFFNLSRLKKRIFMKTGKLEVVLAGILFAFSLAACASNPGAQKVSYGSPETSRQMLFDAQKSVGTDSDSFDLSGIPPVGASGGGIGGEDNTAFSLDKYRSCIDHYKKKSLTKKGKETCLKEFDMSDWQLRFFGEDQSSDALTFGPLFHDGPVHRCYSSVSYVVRGKGDLPIIHVSYKNGKTNVIFPKSFNIKDHRPLFYVVDHSEVSSGLTPYRIADNNSIVVDNDFHEGMLVWINAKNMPVLDITRVAKASSLWVMDGTVLDGKKAVNHFRVSLPEECGVRVASYKNIPFLSGYGRTTLNTGGLSPKLEEVTYPEIQYAPLGISILAGVYRSKEGGYNIQIHMHHVAPVRFRTVGKDHLTVPVMHLFNGSGEVVFSGNALDPSVSGPIPILDDKTGKPSSYRIVLSAKKG